MVFLVEFAGVGVARDLLDVGMDVPNVETPRRSKIKLLFPFTRCVGVVVVLIRRIGICGSGVSGLVDNGVPFKVSFGFKEGEDVFVSKVCFVSEMDGSCIETKLFGFGYNWHSLRR